MAVVLNQSNVKQFFVYQTINIGAMKPGMILSFSYSSPDGIHDPTPLIYVLEKEGDRIWGLNLHYNFALLGQAYNAKLLEVQQQNLNKQPLSQTPNTTKQDVLKDFPKLKKVLPVKSFIPLKKPTNSLTEDFKGKLDQFNLATKSEDILRNYLFVRIRQPQKLLFNINKLK